VDRRSICWVIIHVEKPKSCEHLQFEYPAHCATVAKSSPWSCSRRNPDVPRGSHASGSSISIEPEHVLDPVFIAGFLPLSRHFTEAASTVGDVTSLTLAQMIRSDMILCASESDTVLRLPIKIRCPSKVLKPINYHIHPQTNMKFSLATLAFMALIGITDVNGSACCLSGAVCGKRELGHVYAADTFVPKTLHERDTVVPSASDLTQRAGCCCTATNAAACPDVCGF
jgi:hypothetical protein